MITVEDMYDGADICLGCPRVDECLGRWFSDTDHVPWADALCYDRDRVEHLDKLTRTYLTAVRVWAEQRHGVLSCGVACPRRPCEDCAFV